MCWAAWWGFGPVTSLWPHRLALLTGERSWAPPHADEDKHLPVKAFRRGAPGRGGSHLPVSIRPKVRPLQLCPPHPQPCLVEAPVEAVHGAQGTALLLGPQPLPCCEVDSA